MSTAVTKQARSAFYAAGMLGLRALDARERHARRFGTDADTRWAQFAGSLGAGDRLDLLLRDASGTWGVAFSPSECFGLFGLAEDEPFGPDWGCIDDTSAKRLFAATLAPVSFPQVAATLGIETSPIELPRLTPSTKLVVAGGSAILSVASAFSEDATLSWTDQIVVIADDPACRQLAGLAAVVLGARGRTVVVRTGENAEAAVRTAGFAHLDEVVISPDATAEAAAVARKAGNR